MLLAECIRMIESEYARRSYGLGWKFLYTPAATLTCPTGLMLAAINPGGQRFSTGSTVETGNAYLVEHWPADGANLQAQVRLFFAQLAVSAVGNGMTGEALLNRTLTSNFCPFRSPTWAALPHKAEAIAFSTRLWAMVLSSIHPRVILCMGAAPFRYFHKVLLSLGAEVVAKEALASGWGSMKFRILRFARGERKTTLAYLPHLSQYKLMSRKECRMHVVRFTGRLAP
jgi:hypothetical protein